MHDLAAQLDDAKSRRSSQAEGAEGEAAASGEAAANGEAAARRRAAARGLSQRARTIYEAATGLSDEDLQALMRMLVPLAEERERFRAQLETHGDQTFNV